MKEGQVYEISNFKVKDYLGDEKYRSVRNKKHLFFTPHTQFKEIETVGVKIEKYAFDLFHYDEIDKLADDNRFLIDIVGKVKNVQDLIKIQKNEEEKTLFKFEISNGRSSVQVTFFDYFGEVLEAEFGKLDRRNLFVIISCAKVGRYEGVAHLSNYPATRVFINPQHYSIDQLKKSLAEIRNEPEVLVKHKEDKAAEITKKSLTVKEIKNLPADFEEESVFCEVTVKRFMDKKTWYFMECTRCDLELEQKDAPNANRFRVCTFCSDDTGSLPIIFPDHEITRMLDKTVIDLHAECNDEAEEEKFPEILNFLLKQKYTINLYVNEDNIKKGSAVYYAKEILHAPEKGDNFDHTKATVVEVEEISMQNPTETDATANQTPNTGNSTNNKTRARKVTDALAYNETDAAAIHPHKNIKLEKVSR
ncbi:hypothetical protein ACET3Z_002457 [Daucus carota]